METEAREREALAQQEQEAQREIVARLEADVREREAVALQAAELVTKLEAEAQEREAAARQEAEAQGELVARLEAELREREEAARQEAEAQRELVGWLETEGRERQDAMRQEADAQRELVNNLEAQLRREQASRQEAQRELAVLHEVVQRNVTARRDEPQRHAAAPIPASSAATDTANTSRHPSPGPASRPGPSARELWLRGATDRPSPFVADPASVIEPEPDQTATESAASTPEPVATETKARAARVDSRLPALLTRENNRQPLACIIRDRSSGGAKLEFPSEKYGDAVPELMVGDRFSLTFNTTALERTTVACVVVWIAGNRCGVRFSGQFHTQLNSARKAPEKAAAVKPAKPGLAAGVLRRPFSREG